MNFDQVHQDEKTAVDIRTVFSVLSVFHAMYFLEGGSVLVSCHCSATAFCSLCMICLVFPLVHFVLRVAVPCGSGDSEHSESF